MTKRSVLNTWIAIVTLSAVCLSVLQAQDAADPAPESPPESAPERAPEGVVALVNLIGEVDDASFQLDLLKGINEGLKGRRSVVMPKGWPAVYAKLSKSKNDDVREQARQLALVFGDPAALRELRATMMDTSATLEARKQALEALLQKKAPDLAPDLHRLVAKHEALRLDALRALAAYKHDATPRVVLDVYPKLEGDEKRAALSTLAARLPYARALIKAVQDKRVAVDDVSSETIRQLRLHKDDALQEVIGQLWTVTRATPAQKQKQIADLTMLLSKQTSYKPDLSHGRALYAKTCAQCHQLFDAGGKVGPDLTGSGRANLDYILLNIVDPQATVGRDYFTTVIVTEDGQQVVGIIAAENANAVTLLTANGDVLIPKTEIVERDVREMSMMPEGLLDRLKENELRDLISYLASPTQVPMPTP